MSIKEQSERPDVPAVFGENTRGGIGVYGQSGVRPPILVEEIGHTPEMPYGVSGWSKSGIGVLAYSEKDNGLRAVSEESDGVAGFSHANDHSGVYGNNDLPSANGVTGTSSGGRGLMGLSDNIGIYAKGGQFAGVFDGNVSVNGDQAVTGNLTAHDVVLAGGDCAEDFDIAGREKIEPGTVMVIDQEGMLQPSQQAYDKKVVGVLSGAGDYKPGIVLDKQQSTENRMPVALVGKVYCKVDAHYASIEVGDLLTTSPTSGHAMKADDPLKAFGSVIGKALRPLKTGQGLIPILIALQ